jgi:hypothetical protein
VWEKVCCPESWISLAKSAVFQINKFKIQNSKSMSKNCVCVWSKKFKNYNGKRRLFIILDSVFWAGLYFWSVEI